MRFLLDTLRTFGILGCSLFSGFGEIPESEVPSVIRNSFDTEFSEAMEVEWEKYRETFEVDFEINKADYSALFNKAGEMLMVKQEISIQAIPEPVKERLKKEYASYSIAEVERVKQKGITHYQVELEGRFLEINKVFAENGQESVRIKYWD